MVFLFNFRHQVLQMSSGLEDIGYFPWHLPVSYLVAWVIIFLSLMKGVKSVGKVWYRFMQIEYINGLLQLYSSNIPGLAIHY